MSSQARKKFKRHIKWDKKVELLTEQEINKIKNDTERKLNMLDDEIRNISENLDEDLTTWILRYEIFKNFEWERELGLLTKEKINKIGRLKEEFKNNEEKLLDSETKISKFLKWRIWKNDALHNIVVLNQNQQN